MIKISAKGLVKFILASPAQQRKIVRDYKYPDPEGEAMARYYVEARDFIKKFHKDNHEPSWLEARAGELQHLSSVTTGQTSSRFRNNARAVHQYHEHFSTRNFEVLPDFRQHLIFGAVRITITPDLHVREGQREKIIRLEFSQNAIEQRAISILTQLYFEAQLQAHLGLTSSGVLCFDVPRGGEYRGARAGSRIKREIEAACKTIEDIWDGVPL